MRVVRVVAGGTFDCREVCHELLMQIRPSPALNLLSDCFLAVANLLSVSGRRKKQHTTHTHKCAWEMSGRVNILLSNLCEFSSPVVRCWRCFSVHRGRRDKEDGGREVCFGKDFVITRRTMNGSVTRTALFVLVCEGAVREYARGRVQRAVRGKCDNLL